MADDEKMADDGEETAEEAVEEPKPVVRKTRAKKKPETPRRSLRRRWF